MGRSLEENEKKQTEDGVVLKNVCNSTFCIDNLSSYNTLYFLP